MNQSPERVAYAPAEFAALFGKEKTWAYRLIYSQRVKLLPCEFGRKLIPASEVERILSGACFEAPREQVPPKTKSHLARKAAWNTHLQNLKDGAAKAKQPSNSSKVSLRRGKSSQSDVLDRVRRH